MTIQTIVRAYMKYDLGDADQIIADHPDLSEAEVRRTWDRIAARDDARAATTGYAPRLGKTPAVASVIDTLLEDPGTITREALEHLVDTAALETMMTLRTSGEAADALGIVPQHLRLISRELRAGWLYGDRWLYTPDDVEVLRIREDGRRRSSLSLTTES